MADQTQQPHAPSTSQLVHETREEARQRHDEGRQRITDRLVAFFDAVLAIAITLLALEIAVPEIGNFGTAELQEVFVPFTALFISYLALGQVWFKHAKLFSQLNYRVTDAGIVGHLVLLFFVMLFPKTTQLISLHPSSPYAIVVYLACYVGALVTLAVLVGTARRRQVRRLENAYMERNIQNVGHASLSTLRNMSGDYPDAFDGLVKGFLGILSYETASMVVDFVGITGAVIALIFNPVVCYAFFLADIVVALLCYRKIASLQQTVMACGNSCQLYLEDLEDDPDEDEQAAA